MRLDAYLSSVHGITRAKAKQMIERGMLDELLTAIGLSLGELTAHAIAGTYSFEDGLKIVAERGRLMQEACDASKGAMASLIGSTEEHARQYAEKFDVDISNLNCPGQVVISGEADKIAEAVKAAKEDKTLKMVVPLKVAGAYHSRLMKPARDAFEKFLETVTFKAPSIKVFTNVSGKEVSDPDDIKRNLVSQVVSTVRWADCQNAAAALGVEQFYECGPGGILAGMGRRISKELKIKPVAEFKDFEA